MKSLKKIALITILFLLLIINHSFAATGKVIPNSVRVREKPNTSSEIITNAYKGDSVEILEKDGDWYKVKVDGKTGYIRSDFLKLDESNSNSNSNSDSNNSAENSDIAIVIKSKIRAIPNIISVPLGELEAGTKINKLDELNNWIKVSDGKVTGWVLSTRIGKYEPKEEPEKKEEEPEKEEKKEEQKEETKKEETNSSNVNKVAIINVKTARIRSKAGTDGEIIDLLDYNDEVTITAEEGTWYKIKYNGKEGYIDSSLVVMKDKQGVTSRGQTEERKAKEETVNPESTAEMQETASAAQPVTPPTSGSGQAVVDFARQFLGYPYVSAGKSPETGFDCSGFTKYVFSNFGAALGGTAASQASVGREVSREELVAGDLLLFYDEGYTKIGHTGIYISGGEFIHAANSRRGVVTDNINTSSYYNERYITARRIVE